NVMLLTLARPRGERVHHALTGSLHGVALLAWLPVPARDSPSATPSEAEEQVRGEFGFEVVLRRGRARLGVLTTPHGAVRTPAFVAVGTQATVKSVAPEAVIATGTQLVFANTYHL